MKMKEIIEGILHKSLKLEDIKDQLTKSELDELIKSLAQVKEALAKEGWGLINAMKEKGNGMSAGGSNPGTSTTPTSSASSAAPAPAGKGSTGSTPSIAEQINFGGAFSKKEKVTYFDNGQWDIEDLDKAKNDQIDTGIKTARTAAMMAEATGEKKHIKEAKDSIRTVKDLQGKKRMATDEEKKVIQDAKDKADLKEFRSGKDRRKQRDNVAPLKERRTNDRRDGALKQKLAKSNYKGYTDADNVKRKKNNVETENTGKIKSMPRTKKWGGSGVDAATAEAKKMRRKSKKQPVKVFTPEEIAEINSKAKK